MTAPVNDIITSATVISGTTGSIVGTCAEVVEQTPNDYGAVWYKLTPAFNGYMTFTATQLDGGEIYDLFVTWFDDTSKNFITALDYDHAPDWSSLTQRYTVMADTPIYIGVTMTGGSSSYTPLGGFYNFELSWTSDVPAANESGATVMPITTPYIPSYTLVLDPLVNEIWTQQNSIGQSSPYKSIARFKESTGELLGYIETATLLSDPLVYDPYRERIWASYLSGLNVTSWDAVTYANQGSVTLPRRLQYGDAFSTVDGSLWLAGSFGGATPNRLVNVDPLTGATLSDRTFTERLGEIIFTTTGEMWVVYGGDQYTFDSIRVFDPVAGAFSNTYAVAADGTQRIKRVAYDEDRQVLWVLLTNNFGDPLPAAGDRQDMLAEFNLASRSVVSTRPVAYTEQGPFYSYFVYDTYRKQLIEIDSVANTLTALDTVTGEVKYTAQLSTDGIVVVAPSAPWVMGQDNLYKIGPPAPVVDLDIINDRDVWLQSFTYDQRFEKVTVQFGTVDNINQGQLTGITLTGAKKLSLSVATQFFRVSGAIIEPLSITIIPTLRNLAGTPTYSVIAGSASLTVIGDKVNLLYGAMGSDSVTIKATLGGFEDQITLVKVVAGSSAIRAFLTNESETIICDSVGNIMSYIGASGDFRVFEGALEVSSECVFSVTGNPNDILMVIDNRGHYSVQGIPNTVDATTITLRAIYKGTSYDRTFKILKSKAEAGSTADPSIKIGPDGKRLPVELSIPILGLSWNSAAANAALIPYGGPGLNDIVTEYNSVSNFRETRFFNRVEWLTLEARIDGNLLATGTVSADKLTANAVDAITGTFENLITDRIEAARAEIDTLIAEQIDAVNGNFDTLTVGGTQILPNSINTGHVVNNAISVPATATGSGTVSLSGAGDSTSYPVGTVAYVAAATIISSVTVSVTGGLGGPGFGGANYYEIFITKNGSEVAAATFTAPAGQITSATFAPSLSVGAETATWGFGVRVSSSGGAVNVNNYSASFIGVMK